jgi:hypothetical protein
MICGAASLSRFSVNEIAYLRCPVLLFSGETPRELLLVSIRDPVFSIENRLSATTRTSTVVRVQIAEVVKLDLVKLNDGSVWYNYIRSIFAFIPARHNSVEKFNWVLNLASESSGQRPGSVPAPSSQCRKVFECDLWKSHYPSSAPSSTEKN